jgi:hypothetical protein
MLLRRITAAAFVLGALGMALATPAAPAYAAGGRASVRLVRLLDEVPDSIPGRPGKVHGIRLHLLAGNVLLLRRGGDFIALLPIERREGAVDSLQYFYYLEGGPVLWLFPGTREKAVRTVADGEEIRFSASRLLWRTGPDEGWIYFPNVPGNDGLKFSVVSGRNVDQVDPRDTKYWVELGTPGPSGF